MGVVNNGGVFALFPREAEDDKELELKQGDQLTVLDRSHDNNSGWWLVRNRWSQVGEVPHTYLGVYRRVYEVL